MYCNEPSQLPMCHKEPDGNKSTLGEPVTTTSDTETRLANTSNRYRFSACVASFGQLLRGGKYIKDFNYHDVLELARKSRGNDTFGYRGEFISLVNLARSLSTQALSSQVNKEQNDKVHALR